MCHRLCNVLSNNTACGWLTIKCGLFCNSCAHSTFLRKQCPFPGCPHGSVYLYAKQLWGYQGFPSAVQTHSRISSVCVSLSENYRFWVVDSWAAPMRHLIFLMYLSRRTAAYTYTISYGVSIAICVRMKKHVYLFVFQPPCRMVLKAEVSCTMEKIDKNILIFVKIFLDVF